MADLRISFPVRPWVLLALACLTTYVHHRPVRSTDIEVGECAEIFTHCAPLSCAPRVPPSTAHSVAHQLLLPRVNCRCDTRCRLYGDCCVDYSEHCVNETHPPVLSSKFSSHFKCVTPMDQGSVLLESFYAVGSCPAGWPRDTVRNSCENGTLARSQKLLTMLVNGPDEIVFKNVYCAVCHSIPEDQLDPWYIKLWGCEYEAGTGTYNFDRCDSFKMYPPLSMSSPPHRCYHNLIDSCPSNATESQTALCENSTSNVFSQWTVYKNRHCVSCNGHLDTVLICRVNWRPLVNPSSSFTLLFDFTKQTVCRVDEHWVSGIEQPQILGSCSSWQIHDPFLNVCRDLHWPKEIPNTNHSSQTCLQHFLSQIYILVGSSYNFTSLVEIVQGSMVEPHTIEIYVDFLFAEHVQESLEQFLFENLDNDTCLPCNATTLSMLASSRVGTNNSWLPTCTGVTVDNVRLDEITLSNGRYYLYNNSGYVYRYQAMELVHRTRYNLTTNRGSIETSRQTYLRVCSPFGDSCPVAVFHRNEFLVLGSGEDIIFVHKATEKSFRFDDVWQLPDETLRLCNFLLDNKVHPTWLTRLSMVSFTGSVCSLVSLSMSLLTYFIFPALQNQPGKIVMNLMVALVMAQSVLMVGKTSVQWLCVVRAALLHFAWLAVFLWMTVLASDLAKIIKSNSLPDPHSESSYKVAKLGLVAWGIPAIFVFACYLVSRLSEDQAWAWLEYGGDQCWITDPTHSLLAFGVPVALLLIINCTLVIFMIYKVSVNRRRLAAAQISRNTKTELLVCFKLIVITGVTWSLFFAANLVNSSIFWYIVVVVNSLQGALVGMVFLLKKRVKSLWRQKLSVIFCICCRPRPQEGETAGPSPVNLVRVTMTSGDASPTRNERPEIDSNLH